MMKQILCLMCAAVFVSLAFQVSTAQDARTAAVAAAGDKYIISAKAGGVNYVEGTVAVVRKDGTGGHVLRRDEIAVGDRVSTGADGKVEVLLNPGSFLRLGPDSAFEFKTTSLDNLQINLDHGSAIFEVFASRDFTVRVITPKAKVVLIESGVFRVDVMADGGARVAVWEGRALLGDRSATLVKKGRVAVVKDGTSTVAKLSGSSKDELDAWSKSRGKDIARQTAKLKVSDVRNSLVSSFNGGGWNMFSSFGLWVWNPVFGSYCFLPFGSDWYSPYGHGYGYGIWGYNLPWYVYVPPVRSPVVATTHPTPGVISGGPREPLVPPFTRMPTVGGSRALNVDTEMPGDFRRNSGPEPSRSVFNPSRMPAAPSTPTAPQSVVKPSARVDN